MNNKFSSLQVESTASRNLFLSPDVTEVAFKFEPADQAAKATIYYYLEVILTSMICNNVIWNLFFFI